MTSETRNVLLVEDNRVTSDTLLVFLEAENYHVTRAYTGLEAIECFERQSFDLVMLDLMLPDVGGLEVCSSVRRSSDVPIVILTAKTTEDEIVAGLERGANDYVCKPFSARELMARVNRFFRSPVASSDDLLCVGLLLLNPTERWVTLSGLPLKLTKSEFDILRVLMNQPGRVFTRSQLIDMALGENFDGFDRTIDTHVWSLRKKIGEPRGNPRYLLSEPGVGYRMSDEHAN